MDVYRLLSSCKIYDLFLDQDNIYLENLDASVVILKKLSVEWNVHCVKHSTLEPLKTTLKSFVVKVRMLIGVTHCRRSF